MKKIFCVKHNKNHISEGGWRFGAWDGEDGIIYGWGCTEVRYPEFTSQKIKTERQKYLKSQIQSHRQGELSKEFVQLYPEKIKEMKKAGVISEKDIKKAKNVWQDLPGIGNVEKTL